MTAWLVTLKLATGSELTLKVFARNQSAAEYQASRKAEKNGLLVVRTVVSHPCAA